MEPTIGEGVTTFFLFLPVAEHDLWSLGPQLTRLTDFHFGALLIHALHISGGRWNSNTAVLDGSPQGVKGQHRRGLGESVTLHDGGLSQGAPASGHRLVQGHSARSGGHQVLGWSLAKPALVEQSVEEGIHPGQPGHLVVLKHTLEVAGWPGSWHQKVARTHVEKAQQIHRESEDVIQRQGRDHDFLTGSDELPVHLQHLHGVAH